MDAFFGILSVLRWQDLIDILFNSYVLFRLYVLFRGTSVIRVLLVICVLLIIRQMALGMGLIITSWAMQGIIAAAALIIIIVFRNEIAGVLQTKSLKSFFWGIPRYQRHTPVSIIVESVYELARKKIGALIVLPIKQGLQNSVQEGLAWNGRLSREMLLSIFWKDNPVHDGACVIQGGRVTDVGVILPLSKRQDLPSHFGTRHRAAMGLSEQTDALILVVSEERGKISLIRESRIYDINDSNILTQLLDHHLGKESSAKGLKSQTAELAVVAAMCLFSVIGLWLNFSTGQETLATREVPIEFINLESKMEISGSSSNSVKLLISGARPLVQALGQDQVKVRVDVSKALPGVNTIGIQQENVLLPPGIQLKQVEPASVELTVDVPVKKMLVVQPAWSGRLKEGLIMVSAEPEPRTVTVRGPTLSLTEQETLFTEPIPLESISESGSVTTAFALAQSNLKLPDTIKNSVTIRFVIEKRSDF